MNEKSIEIKNHVINKNKNLFKGSRYYREKEVTLLENTIREVFEMFMNEVGRREQEKSLIKMKFSDVNSCINLQHDNHDINLSIKFFDYILPEDIISARIINYSEKVSGEWSQNIFKELEITVEFKYKNNTIKKLFEIRERFKKPRPPRPVATREIDCYAYCVKVDGHWREWKWIPLSPGDGYPSRLNVHYHWYWEIGRIAFPRFTGINRAEENTTVYYNWGDTCKIRENGVERTLILEW